MAGRTALIAGATGLVGGHCLHRLLAHEAYDRVKALTRRDLGKTHAKLEEVRVDFDRLRAHRDRLGADDVFLCLGTTLKQAGSQRRFREVDYGYNLAVAQAAHLAGAKQVLLVSSIGASPRSRTLYLRIKGELEAAISMLPYRSHHVFRPAMLLGERRESRPLEAVSAAFARASAFAMVGGLRRFRAVQAQVVAAALVTAAVDQQPGAHLYWYDDIQALAAGRQPAPA